MTFPISAHVKSEDVTWLMRVIKGRRMTACQILGEMNIDKKDVTENMKRVIRAIANASHGNITGGQKGYQITQEMTPKEFRDCQTETLAKIQEMKTGYYARETVYNFPTTSPH